MPFNQLVEGAFNQVVRDSNDIDLSDHEMSTAAEDQEDPAAEDSIMRTYCYDTMYDEAALSIQSSEPKKLEVELRDSDNKPEDLSFGLVDPGFAFFD